MIYALSTVLFRHPAWQYLALGAGLVAYLRGGGLLAVFPSGPMPFHYDETGNAVGHSADGSHRDATTLSDNRNLDPHDNSLSIYADAARTASAPSTALAASSRRLPSSLRSSASD